MLHSIRVKVTQGDNNAMNTINTMMTMNTMNIMNTMSPINTDFQKENICLGALFVCVCVCVCVWGEGGGFKD